MSTLEVEMVDIHEWEAEESPDNREEERKKIKDLLTRSIIANKGNPGMVNRILKTGVTDPQKHKCHAAFIWYTIEQQNTLPEETAYTDQSGWIDKAADLRPLHLEAIGEEGRIEKGRINRILKQTRKSGIIHFATKEVDNICKEDMKPFARELKEEDKTLKGPDVGAYSYKLGWCGMQLLCPPNEMCFYRCIVWALILTGNTCGIAHFTAKQGHFIKIILKFYFGFFLESQFR